MADPPSPGRARPPILVTGASSGLGRHFARMLAAAGHPILAAARRAPELATLAAEIAAAGGRAATFALDVTDAAAVDATVAAAAASFGPLGGLVNNAGINESAPLLDQDIAAWDRVLATNLRGAFLVARAVAKGMARAGGGAIVNIASILGLRQAGGVGAYATAKAGLIQLTREMALEWARHGIRVNALAPGYIETPLNRDFFASPEGQAMIRRIPARRLGRPEDLDAALRLLLSPEAGYITGAVLAVDGGHLVSGL